MNGSATKWISTSVPGKYEKCSNGNLSNGNHMFIKEIVNVSTMHTKVSTTKTVTSANMTLSSETEEKMVTEFSMSGVTEFKEVDSGSKQEVDSHADNSENDKADRVYDSDDSEEENSKGLTKSFLDGLTICQYKLKWVWNFFRIIWLSFLCFILTSPDTNSPSLYKCFAVYIFFHQAMF